VPADAVFADRFFDRSKPGAVSSGAGTA
jgi:hypothetical protein